MQYSGPRMLEEQKYDNSQKGRQRQNMISKGEEREGGESGIEGKKGRKGVQPRQYR